MRGESNAATSAVLEAAQRSISPISAMIALDDRGLGRGEGLRGQVELVVLHQARAVGQRARTVAAWAAARKGSQITQASTEPRSNARAGVGRAAGRPARCRCRRGRPFQCLDQQVLDVRALVEGDLAALQPGNVGDRRVLGNEDRLALRRRRLVADIEQRRARGLGEDRRRLAGGAEVDGPDVERLEQLRPARELGPGHRPALRAPAAFQQAALLEEHQRAVLLDADAQLALGRERGQRQAQARCGQASQPHQIASLHRTLRQGLRYRGGKRIMSI